MTSDQGDLPKPSGEDGLPAPKNYQERVAQRKVELERKFGPRNPQALSEDTSQMEHVNSERKKHINGLINGILNECLSPEEVDAFKEEGEYFEGTILVLGGRGGPMVKFFGDEADLKDSYPYVPDTTSGPVIFLDMENLGDEEVESTRYGNIPSVFADLKGNVYMVEVEGFLTLKDDTAFIVEKISPYTPSKSSDTYPKVGFEVDMEGEKERVIGMRNFEVEEYSKVEDLISGLKEKTCEFEFEPI
jgi:hypothetical protein